MKPGKQLAYILSTILSLPLVLAQTVTSFGSAASAIGNVMAGVYQILASIFNPSPILQNTAVAIGMSRFGIFIIVFVAINRALSNLWNKDGNNSDGRRNAGIAAFAASLIGALFTPAELAIAFGILLIPLGIAGVASAHAFRTERKWFGFVIMVCATVFIIAYAAIHPRPPGINLIIINRLLGAVNTLMMLATLIAFLRALGATNFGEGVSNTRNNYRQARGNSTPNAPGRGGGDGSGGANPTSPEAPPSPNTSGENITVRGRVIETSSETTQYPGSGTRQEQIDWIQQIVERDDSATGRDGDTVHITYEKDGAAHTSAQVTTGENDGVHGRFEIPDIPIGATNVQFHSTSPTGRTKTLCPRETEITQGTQAIFKFVIIEKSAGSPSELTIRGRLVEKDTWKNADVDTPLSSVSGQQEAWLRGLIENNGSATGMNGEEIEMTFKYGGNPYKTPLIKTREINGVDGSFEIPSVPVGVTEIEFHCTSGNIKVIFPHGVEDLTENTKQRFAGVILEKESQPSGTILILPEDSRNHSNPLQPDFGSNTVPVFDVDGETETARFTIKGGTGKKYVHVFLYNAIDGAVSKLDLDQYHIKDCFITLKDSGGGGHQRRKYDWPDNLFTVEFPVEDTTVEVEMTAKTIPPGTLKALKVFVLVQDDKHEAVKQGEISAKAFNLTRQNIPSSKLTAENVHDVNYMQIVIYKA